MAEYSQIRDIDISTYLAYIIVYALIILASCLKQSSLYNTMLNIHIQNLHELLVSRSCSQSVLPNRYVMLVE